MHIRTIRTLAVAAMTLLGTGIPLSVPAQETGAKKEAVKTENYSFSVKTDKADAIYKKGEPVTFTVQLLKDKKPVSGVKLQYRLSANGDWGKMQSAVSDKPVVATTKLDKPGWVSIEVYAIGPDGKRVKKPRKTSICAARSAQWSLRLKSRNPPPNPPISMRSGKLSAKHSTRSPFRRNAKKSPFRKSSKTKPSVTT